MNFNGKAQLSFMIIAPLELEAEGDRLFKLHAEWMGKTHHREGEKALLQYTLSKSPDSDGRVIFILTEVYETVAGIEDHRKQAHNADFFNDLMKFNDHCQVIGGGDGMVIHSL